MTATALVAVAGPAGSEPAERSTPRDTRPLDVVVLGDSYSAGNAAGPASRRYGPSGCVRSKDVWSERYATLLRARGMTVRVANHACSGGVAADLVSPRAMDDPATGSYTVPSSDSDAGAAKRLRAGDPCNTGAFPREEFWRYTVTKREGTTLSYTCQRFLRPQTDFVTPDTDLVLFTMGGNDAGFTNIVMQCFLWKSPDSCRGAIDGARAKLPAIRAKIATGIARMRANGLRRDARVVQMGYPHLQTDTGYTVGLLTGSYAAGDAVRALVTDGNRELAKVAARAGAKVPGQVRFLSGVPERFAGHEPDAGGSNAERWLMQILDPAAVDLSDYYHPNAQGQQAYAELLAAKGDFGASHGRPRATITVKRPGRGARVVANRRLAVVAKVRVSNAVNARGTVRVIRAGRRLAATTLRPRNHGRAVLRLAGLRPGKHRLVLRYRSPDGARAVVRLTVRAGR
ncbi:hypothetical protein NODU109028_13905 [Nocardioides dubius]